MPLHAIACPSIDSQTSLLFTKKQDWKKVQGSAAFYFLYNGILTVKVVPLSTSLSTSIVPLFMVTKS